MKKNLYIQQLPHDAVEFVVSAKASFSQNYLTFAISSKNRSSSTKKASATIYNRSKSHWVELKAT